MIDLKNNIEDFELLKKTISKTIGFKCLNYSDSFLRRRMETRFRSTNPNTINDYCKLLEGDIGQERAKLLKEFTIHTTNFFRDTSMWLAFINNTLPKLIDYKKTNHNNSINIWSAGSSSGEEAVTICICLHEVLGDNIKNYKIRMLGTDYEPEMLKVSKEAIYDEKQFKEMPEEFLNKYFDIVSPKMYTPKSFIKDMIMYETGDIFLEKKHIRWDFIFCRNTVIYFSELAKIGIYEKFYGELNDYGILILGKTEALQGPAREKFKLLDLKERIYEKSKE